MVELLLPKSDALSKDQNGMTALIYAAYSGHEACLRLLLPASDACAKDGRGFTAGKLIRKLGYEVLAQFIDAYALAQSEQATIEAASSSGAPRGRTSLRV